MIVHPAVPALQRGRRAHRRRMAFARRALESRGSAQRMNRNELVFLAPDARRMEELEEAVRDYLAWLSIAGSEDRIIELGLSAQQAGQARKRLRDADQAVSLRITDTYHWVIVPVQPLADRPVNWDVLRADGARDRLAERASDKLTQADLLRTVHGARSIRYDLDNRLPSVWQKGHVEVGELWGYYSRHPYLPRLRERTVLDEGILGVANELTWDAEAFAIATGYDSQTGRYLGLAIPHQDPIGQVTDRTLLVHPDLALLQRDEEATERATVSQPSPPAPVGTSATSGSGDAGAGSTGDQSCLAENSARVGLAARRTQEHAVFRCCHHQS